MNKEEARLQMMDYLYDEMTHQQKSEFEAYIKKHPELQQELHDLYNTKQLLEFVPENENRKGLGHRNKEARAPGRKSRGFFTPGVKTVMAIAASVLVILFGSSIAGLQISNTDEGFLISFNGTDQALKAEPVNTVSDEDLLALAEQIRTENRLLMTSMMDELQSQQRVQLQETIRVLNTYYERQREEDLTMIADGLSQLQVETAYRFLQTDETLENIIYAINNQ